MIPQDTKIGTKLYVIPIRFWEKQREMCTATLAVHKTHLGEILRSVTSDGFVYVYSDEYGHEVYLQQKETFLTFEEANEEREKLIEEKNLKDNEEHEALMKKIFALRKKEA